MILAVVPARKGSKRLPGKNIQKLGNKPLVAWTFEAALKAKTLDRIIVSTDDPEVKRITEDYGIEVPFFPRPPKISEDVDTALVLKHVVDWLTENEELEWHPNDLIVTLQPTSPFRLPDDIDGAIKKRKEKNCSAVITVSEMIQHPFWAFNLGHNDLLLSHRPSALKGYMLVSQNLPKLYYPNGAVYVGSKLLVDSGRIFARSHDNYGYVMPRERSVDIETELDLIYAQALLDKGVIKR